MPNGGGEGLYGLHDLNTLWCLGGQMSARAWMRAHVCDGGGAWYQQLSGEHMMEESGPQPGYGGMSVCVCIRDNQLLNRSLTHNQT